MSGKRLALIIASSQFEDKDLSQLIAPAQDAEELARVLGNPEIGNFEVQTLINRSGEEVRQTIDAFFQDRSRDDLLLLYYSGHGIKDENGQLYFALPNTKRKYLRSTAISSQLLHDSMEDSRSRRQVLILDCCYSGAFTRGLRSRDDRQIGTKERFEGHGRVILTASDNMQYAFEGDHLTGEGVQSIFTSSLLKGLETWDADLNGDGEIDLNELYEYVYAEVRDKTTKMSPRRWVDVEGEIIIARNPNWVGKPHKNIKLEKQLDQIYIEGLNAFWIEDWDNARVKFQEVTKHQPNYKDVADKLYKVEQKISFSQRYSKAQAELEGKNYLGALELFEALHQEEPENKELENLLGKTRKLVQVEKLYEEATQLFEAKQWLAAIKVFERIKGILSNYEDVDSLLAKAKTFLSEQEREEKLSALYRDALQEMDAGNWKEARKLLLQIQKQDAQYKDLKKLLSRVETELSRTQFEATTSQSAMATPKTKGEPLRKIPRSAWIGGGFIGIILLFMVLWSAGNLKGMLGSENTTSTPTRTPSSTHSVAVTSTIKPQKTPEPIHSPDSSATKTPTPRKTPTKSTIPTSTHTKTPSIIEISDDFGVSMVLIPAGSFAMGNERWGPIHTVYLDEFYIDKTEVTNEQYKMCVDEGVCIERNSSELRDPSYTQYPIRYLSGLDAQNFCAWRGGALPTEAQWEKAARGGLDGMDYPWGNELPVCTLGAFNGAQYLDCDGDTVPVGSFAPNNYGLYDMAGNVIEWASDWYDNDYYSISPENNPKGPDSGFYRVSRGGSWEMNFAGATLFLEVAARNGSYDFYNRARGEGVRCSQTP